MIVHKIFYSCVAVGMLFGMAIIVLINGLGNEHVWDGVVGFFMLGGFAALGAVSIIKKLNLIWNDNIPLLFQYNKPAECFKCNETGCEYCEILSNWRMLDKKEVMLDATEKVNPKKSR